MGPFGAQMLLIILTLGNTAFLGLIHILPEKDTVSHSYSFLYACVLYANGHTVGTVWTSACKMTMAYVGLVGMIPMLIKKAGVRSAAS